MFKFKAEDQVLFKDLMEDFDFKSLFRQGKYTIIVNHTSDNFEAVFWPDLKTTHVRLWIDKRFLKALHINFNRNDKCWIREWLWWGDIDSEVLPPSAKAKCRDYWNFCSYYDLGKNFLPVEGGDDSKYRGSNGIVRPFVNFEGIGKEGKSISLKQYNHSSYDKFRKLGISSEGGYDNSQRVALERLSLFVDQRIFQNLHESIIHPNVFDYAIKCNLPYKATDESLVLNSSLIQHLRELRDEGQFGLCLGLIQKIVNESDKQTARALVFG